MKKNNEIKTTDTVKFMPFNTLKDAYSSLTNGVDYLSDEEADLSTIPNRINHSTYGISRLIKPFSIAGDKSCETAKNYLSQVVVSIDSLDMGMLAKDEKYNLYKILHPAVQLIHNDLNKVLSKCNIKCNKLYNIYESEMTEVVENCYKELAMVFNPTCLDQIEQMMALYSSFNESNEELTIEVPLTLVSPFVNEVVMRILYNLYNYAIGLLFKVTIYDNMITGTDYLLDNFESELLNTFTKIHDNFIDQFSYVVVNWVLCRTPQDIPKELQNNENK